MRPSLYGLLLVGLVVLAAPVITPYDPMQTDPAAVAQPPNADHLLGTDRLGRDVLSRALYGGQRTLAIAALSTGLAVTVGLIAGLAAGMSPRWLDSVLITLIDALLAFPGLLLALVIVTLLGANGTALVIAIGVSLIAPYARVTRSAVRSAQTLGCVDAARGLGATGWGILWRHILSNARPTLLAYLGVTFSYALLNNAALSFLGLGGDLGVPDWGVMLYEGRVAFRVAPWIGLAPGLLVMLIVAFVNDLVQRIN